MFDKYLVESQTSRSFTIAAIGNMIAGQILDITEPDSRKELATHIWRCKIHNDEWELAFALSKGYLLQQLPVLKKIKLPTTILQESEKIKLYLEFVGFGGSFIDVQSIDDQYWPKILDDLRCYVPAYSSFPGSKYATTVKRIRELTGMTYNDSRDFVNKYKFPWL